MPQWQANTEDHAWLADAPVRGFYGECGKVYQCFGHIEQSMLTVFSESSSLEL